MSLQTTSARLRNEMIQLCNRHDLSGFSCTFLLPSYETVTVWAHRNATGGLLEHLATIMSDELEDLGAGAISRKKGVLREPPPAPLDPDDPGDAEKKQAIQTIRDSIKELNSICCNPSAAVFALEHAIKQVKTLYKMG